MFSSYFIPYSLRRARTLSGTLSSFRLESANTAFIRPISRFPHKTPGTSRPLRKARPVIAKRELIESQNVEKDIRHSDDPRNSLEEVPAVSTSQLWQESHMRPTGNPREGLKRLLSNDILVVTRQIEMLNIFLGFEQSNKYAIYNAEGNIAGYIAEEEGSFTSTISRQLLRTHRPFRAVIMDTEGTPILWLRRPFQWINSRMFVQRLQEENEYTPDGEPVLDTFAEVQQRWHAYRRRYDLFLRDSPKRILSLASERQPEPEPVSFNQFARVDSGFLAWNFRLYDARGEVIAKISRNFRGLGREVFTDTGQYALSFKPPPEGDANSEESAKSTVIRELTLEERASVLALAVNIDSDYFSRHSTGWPGLGLLFMLD